MMRAMMMVVTAALLGFVPAAGQLVDYQEYGDWHYGAAKDPMTDEISHMASLMGEPRLGFACDHEVGLTAVYHIGGLMIGNREGMVRVRYRVDSAPASGYQWWTLHQDTYASIPLAGSTALAQSLGTGERQVIMEITDPADSEIRHHTFSLVGFSDALARLPCV